MPTPPINPYRPPVADVTNVSVSSGQEFAAPGIRVETGRSIAWLSEGWELFKQAPLMWILVVLIVSGINFVLGLIPFVGALATCVLMPVFSVGILAFARAQTKGEGADINRLFVGFQEKLSNLVIVGLLYLLMNIGIFVIGAIWVFIMVSAGVSLGGFSSVASEQAVQQMLLNGMGLGGGLGLLVIMALMIVVGTAYVFAPALVFYANLGVVDAFKESFAAVWRNWLPMLVYGFVVAVLILVGCVPFLLGLFVAGPVIAASYYACFRDIFGRR